MIRIAWDNLYAHPLPEGHRFPMEKYNLIPEQLKHQGLITESNIYKPYELEEEWILNTHDSDYWQKLKHLQLHKQEERRIGFPVTSDLVRRERIICQGTVQTALFALQDGVSLNVAGGTHHAGSNWGEGFCLLNDIAIAANYLITKKHAERVLIIDLDVHQGNGTAQIFRDAKNVFTLSIHGEKNFPFNKEKSHLDIALPDNVSDEAYLDCVNMAIEEAMDHFSPDFVFYQSGVDILASDKLGKLAVSQEGCRLRDHLVFDTCYRNKLPIAVSMGGGYSENIRDIVNAHCQTFQEAFRIFS